ncbi:MAG TPA: Uma2 family endonuclease [Solirubrobacterales bacterium]|nr:Uma2 family endonuclease [Solirubrobacterales bacterium]
MAAIPLQRDIDYPESDGRPLGESDVHRTEIVDLIYALDTRYEDRPDVYVAGDLLLYYVRGDRRAVVCPDVFLVQGVAKGLRRTYKLWEEGRVPSLVIEVTSASSRREDVEKKVVYARLGVEEYFLFDPLREYLAPSFQGFRLHRGVYRAIEPAAEGALTSETTGLKLRREGEHLRLFDLATGEALPTSKEERRLRLQAERRAAEESTARQAAAARAAAAGAARQAAEEEIARLRRELAERA